MATFLVVSSCHLPSGRAAAAGREPQDANLLRFDGNTNSDDAEQLLHSHRNPHPHPYLDAHQQRQPENFTKRFPALCTRCGQRFKHKSVLKHHRFIHDEHKPYSCGPCGVSFRQRATLLRHNQSRRHYLKTALLSRLSLPMPPLKIRAIRAGRGGSHQLGTCNSPRPYGLPRHLLLKKSTPSAAQCPKPGGAAARPFRCSNCSTWIRRLGQRHGCSSDTHYQRYRCGDCDKVFSHSKSLREHANLHTGAKPFPCRFCSSVFGLQPAASRHMKTCKSRPKEEEASNCTAPE